MSSYSALIIGKNIETGLDNIPEKVLTLCYEKESIVIKASVTDNINEETNVNLRNLFTAILGHTDNSCKLALNKISILDLSHCGLEELPRGFESLNLKHLCLSHNNFTNIPRCLYNGLKDVMTLDLSYNVIKIFDIEPDCISSVKVIKLNNNKFEKMPKWFLNFKCINLEEFDYSSNKAIHYEYLKNSYSMNLIKLRELKLTNSCVIDKDYNFLRCFKLLQYLDLSNEHNKNVNRFHDIDELFVKLKWKQLKVLKLNSLSISFFPEGIAWLESLVELYMVNNSISWLPDDIKYMVNLELIDISHNSIVNIPEAVSKLERLKVLKASDNKIEMVPDLLKLLYLTTIDLYNNLLEDILYNTKVVRYVDLEYNYIDTKHLGDDYSQQKQLYRLGTNKRTDGPKEQIVHISSDSSTSSNSEEEEIQYSFYIPLDRNTVNEEENWDLPKRAKKRHSDVDSVDDEWQGEEFAIKKEPGRASVKVYVADEDWMFTDGEEFL